VKDPEFYGDSFDNARSILEAHDVDHARQRRILSHAFSEQALRDQEGLIHQYTDLLVSKLHEQVTKPEKGKIDLVRWLNFTTFDSKLIPNPN
jgi:cytochrome P450